MTTFHVPGLTDEQSEQLATMLQQRLTACNDLHLTLKHIHWNVVGPTFIAVHEMLDPQVELVRGYADEIAERIATLGGSPNGLMGAGVAERSWDDYDLGRDTAQAHLGALDLVYVGMVKDHRAGIELAGDLDPVTEDMLIGQTAELEKFQWFVRAHLEDQGGQLPTAGESTEAGASAAAR
jgi:starvation-inducible DNA-binding protein